MPYLFFSVSFGMTRKLREDLQLHSAIIWNNLTLLVINILRNKRISGPYFSKKIASILLIFLAEMSGISFY